MLKKILILVDGSDFSKRAAVLGKELGDALKSKIIILNVVDIAFPEPVPRTARINIDLNQVYDNAIKSSEELIASIKKVFVDMEYEIETVILHGNPSDAIVDYIRHNEIDLVIMGAHGTKGDIDQIFTGNTTRKVMNHIKVPVLISK